VTEAGWRVIVMPSARRQLGNVPEKVLGALSGAIDVLAVEPRRVGKPLRREYEGLWVARRGPYRVIYRIDDAAREVQVLTVAHRADAYRAR
jgi:mRNA-degrading endonuclease RelE of RelBE toxin-antitoxin system